MHIKITASLLMVPFLLLFLSGTASSKDELICETERSQLLKEDGGYKIFRFEKSSIKVRLSTTSVVGLCFITAYHKQEEGKWERILSSYTNWWGGKGDGVPKEPKFLSKKIGNSEYRFSSSRSESNVFEKSVCNLSIKEITDAEKNYNCDGIRVSLDPSDSVIIELTSQVERVQRGKTKVVKVPRGVQKYEEIAVSYSREVAFSDDSDPELPGGVSYSLVRQAINDNISSHYSSGISETITRNSGVTMNGDVCDKWSISVFLSRRKGYVRSPSIGILKSIPFTFTDDAEIVIEPGKACKAENNTMSSIKEED